jgi:hypothetical protein
MYTDNKQVRNVAEAAYKIMMGEKLHPNQQVLDVHEPEKDELTADDFKKLRAKKEVKKEEVEQQDEASSPAQQAAIAIAMKKAGKKPKNEEVEQMDEVKMADLPSTKVQGRSYGSSKPEPHAVDTLSGPKEKELKDIDAEKKKKKFSEMVSLYQDKGLKSLSEMLAKEETEVAVSTLDVDDINGVQISIVQEEVEQVEERQMSDDEMNKREDIVKSMKKGMAGFKERYGKDAKSVMYATATKQSMKD